MSSHPPSIFGIDQIVSKFGKIPGAQLVGWQRVGLPIFQLRLRLVMLERQPISPIDEFLLRCVGTGIDRNVDLATFLGLDLKTVDSHLCELHRTELLSVAGQEIGSTIAVALTPRGGEVAKQLTANRTQEEIVTLFVHGLSREPMAVGSSELLNEDVCRAQQLTLLSPCPSKRPSLDELRVESVSQALLPFWRRLKRQVDVLAIAGIERVGGLKFEPGVMLEYESESKGRPSYSFIVDGERKAACDREFAKHGGPKRIMNLVEFNRALTREDIANTYLESVDESISKRLNVKEALAQDDAIREIRERVENARKEGSQVASDSDTRQRQASRIKELEAQLSEAEKRKVALGIAILHSADACYRTLIEAIEEAKQALIIVSGTVSMPALEALVPRIETAIRNRDIKVWLGYGMNKNTKQGENFRSGFGFDDCINTMKHLEKRFRNNMHLVDMGNSHDKMLICDKAFFVAGGFNWLSHKPIGRNPMSDNAIKVLDCAIVSQQYDSWQSRFSRIQAKSLGKQRR